MSKSNAQGTIPKFASFRPKPTVQDGNEGLYTLKRSEVVSSDHKERRHHHHHRRRRSRSRDKTRERPHSRAIEGSVAEIPVKEDISQLFIEDRKGDIQNLVYGSIHRYSVPRFYRTGARSVLGAQRFLKINQSSSEDKGIALTDRQDDGGGKREKYVFSRNEKKATRLLKIRPDIATDSAEIGNADFISLRISNPRKRKRTEYHSNDASDDDKSHYRSIEGKAKVATMPPDENLEYATDSDSSGPESGRTIRYDETIRLKTVELSRRVDEHPQDIQAWIDLIDHQDNLLGLGDGEYRKVTSAERRSTADIKLHLYEKALTKAGSTLANRERLLLGMMKEGSQIWDFKTQSQRWEQISQDNLDSVLLWKQYLDFRQSAFATFGYEEVRAVFVKRIKLLNKAINNGAKSEAEISLLYEHLLYTLLRVTLFMREAGYTEIAVAVWQALLESNFFAPSHTMLRTARLKSFKEFWESEVPRIGEENSRGWRNFSDSSVAPEGKTDEEVPYKYLQSVDRFTEWAAAERFREEASKEPARTMDEVTEDDPYRVILWSDIEDFIIDLPKDSLSSGISSLLVDAFLLFCRLPPINDSDSRSRLWWMDSFVRGELLEWSETWVSNQYSEAFIAETPTTVPPIKDVVDADNLSVESSRPLHIPSHYFACSLDSMFPPEYWVNPFEPWHLTYDHSKSGQQDSRTSGPVKYKWLRNILKSLATIGTHSNIGEYFLAFEWHNEPRKIKEAAKYLLKQHPQSLRLYNAYALIEFSRGNRQAAVNVITAALGMRTSVSEEEQQNAILLWRTWIWASLDDGDITGSLKCLLCIADGATDLDKIDTSSLAALLKAKQFISSMRDLLLSTGNLHYAIIYAECLALLEYLSAASGTEPTSYKQGHIAGALSSFDKFSGEMVARGYRASMAHEILHQKSTRLLVHHTRSGPFRPALLRTRLTESLTLFPHNTIFLSLYAWNESRLRIADRVRTVLRTLVLTESNDTITGRLFAIRHELRAGTVHSAHAAFEHAISSPAGRSSPGLWRLYILFCTHSRGFRELAKDLFYRAVRACPWAKELLMMAFTTELRRQMLFRECMSIYRVLSEKELRLHVDLEEDDDRAG